MRWATSPVNTHFPVGLAAAYVLAAVLTALRPLRSAAPGVDLVIGCQANWEALWEVLGGILMPGLAMGRRVIPSPVDSNRSCAPEFAGWSGSRSFPSGAPSRSAPATGALPVGDCRRPTEAGSVPVAGRE